MVQDPLGANTVQEVRPRVSWTVELAYAAGMLKRVEITNTPRNMTLALLDFFIGAFATYDGYIFDVCIVLQSITCAKSENHDQDLQT